MGIRNYPLAFDLMKKNSDLLGKLSQLTPSDRAETILYTSVAFMAQKNFKLAAASLGKVIHLEHLQNDQLRRELRLINLVVHFQLLDFNYLVSEIRSLERELKRSKKYFQTEAVLLKMMKKYPMTLSRNAKSKLFDEVIEELKVLIESPFEQHLFRVFDFVEWVKKLKLNE